METEDIEGFPHNTVRLKNHYFSKLGLSLTVYIAPCLRACARVDDKSPVVFGSTWDELETNLVASIAQERTDRLMWYPYHHRIEEICFDVLGRPSRDLPDGALVFVAEDEDKLNRALTDIRHCHDKEVAALRARQQEEVAKTLSVISTPLDVKRTKK